MRRAVLTIAAAPPDRRHIVFAVNVVETEQEMRNGLSHQTMVKNGLVFPHHGESVATYTFRAMIATVDLIAVDTAGIVRLAQACIPPRAPDLELRGFPLSLVIELPRGTIARENIQVGARVLSLQ